MRDYDVSIKFENNTYNILQLKQGNKIKYIFDRHTLSQF